MIQTTDPPPVIDGRELRTGQFVKGNACAKGRKKPHAARIAALRRALISSVNDADVRRIMRALRDKALDEGDVRAAECFLRYAGLSSPGEPEDSSPRAIAQAMLEMHRHARQADAVDPEARPDAA